jgi:serine/threonine protein kinase
MSYIPSNISSSLDSNSLSHVFTIELDLSQVKPILPLDHPSQFIITNNEIGQGAHARVFEACLKSSYSPPIFSSNKIPKPISFNTIINTINQKQSTCKYAAKRLVRGDYNFKPDLPFCLSTIEANALEASTLKVLSDLEIGPHVYEIYSTDDYDYIIMDRYDGNVQKLLENKIINNLSGYLETESNNNESIEELENEIYSMIDNLIEKVHQAGIVHRDFTLDNIFYKYTNDNKLKLVIGDTGSSIFSNDKDIQKDDHLDEYPRIEFTRNGNACSDWQ